MQGNQANEDSDQFRSACDAMGKRIFPHTAHIPPATPPLSTASDISALSESDATRHASSSEKQPTTSLPHAESELVDILQQLPQSTAVQVLRASPCTVDEQLLRLPVRLHHLALHAGFPELAGSSSLHLDCQEHSLQTSAAALQLFQRLNRPERLSILNLSVLEVAVVRGSPALEAGIWGAVKVYRALHVYDQARGVFFSRSNENLDECIQHPTLLMMRGLSANTHITSLHVQGINLPFFSNVHLPIVHTHPFCRQLNLATLEHLHVGEPILHSKAGFGHDPCKHVPQIPTLEPPYGKYRFEQAIYSHVFSNLISLVLNSCDPTGLGGVTLPSPMNRLRDLQLVVGERALPCKREEFLALFRSLQSLDELTRLVLAIHHNDECLDEQQLSVLVSAVVGLPKLQELSLSVTGVHTGALALLRTLSTSAALTSLSLHAATGDAANVSFAEVLQRASGVQSLQRLQLTDCMPLLKWAWGAGSTAEVGSPMPMHAPSQLPALT